MLEPNVQAVRRGRSTTVLAIVVLALALACWLVALQRLRWMEMGPRTNLGSFPFFLGVWVTMTAAMMLPSALPMVLLFDRVARGRRAASKPTPATSIFVASYLVVWAGFGIAAFVIYRALRSPNWSLLSWHQHGAVLAGAAVAAAGLYELPPLKRACLRHCRSPLHYVLGGWRPGLRGAILMGAEHGSYCVGCCWGLMLILFALGVMSITWMVLVTTVIFMQKVLPWGPLLQRVSAPALLGFGIWIAIDPASVPGLTLPM